MPWITPIGVDHRNLQWIQFPNQFVVMVNHIAGNTGLAIPDLAQITARTADVSVYLSQPFWRRLQVAVEWLAYQFRDQAYYGLVSPLDAPYLTWAGLEAHVGRSIWRSCAGLQWPSDWEDPLDPAYTDIGLWAQASVGAYFGPWIIADLQAAIPQLQWYVKDLGGGGYESTLFDWTGSPPA